ncbi:DNA polymerase III subunit delta' [Oceanicella actignis]|uniref:DNA polymerase-3 subunit delta n=1 Tax=Oceanicella actignis TaxID=1189325 RepID=A0A1M7TI24_9RHOB|nr:DNA polymerase III subunit delta' [Oceanicella actignis]TYO88423.1 DNA polymerase III delta prime subunit [Oceanicella actignis]SET58083.1 DNA polymerase III, delta prime subunit [Oceanicella actignis]SHN70429.1 DNA polymerase-3 subunit delta' [Oceanicella actignis]
MRRPAEIEPEAAPPEPDRVEGAPHPREAVALFGQEAAERAFLDAWRGGRLHHAWLLEGPRGVGKATLAWRIARAVLAWSEGGAEGPAPDSLALDPAHPVFRRAAALAEPRLRLLRRGWDPARKRLRAQIVVEDARAMAELFRRTAADGGWRAAIVDSADDLNPSAANALLKLIEEPPARSLFLLVSHAPAGLLPTIRSRCRRLALRPLAAEPLARAIGLDPASDEAATLAALAAGSAGEALRLRAADGPALFRRLARLLAGAPGMDRVEMQRLAAECAGPAGEERFDAALRLLALLLARLARGAALGAAPEAATPEEEALHRRLGGGEARARIWAEAAMTAPARARAARAVNLDPAQIMLDTLLALDAAAARAARQA